MAAAAAPSAAPRVLRRGWNIFDPVDTSEPMTEEDCVMPAHLIPDHLARKAYMSFFSEFGPYSHLIDSFNDMFKTMLPHMIAEYGVIIIVSEKTQTVHVFTIKPPNEIRRPQKKERSGYVSDLTVREARDRGLHYEAAVIVDIVHDTYKPRDGAPPIRLPRRPGAPPEEIPPAISTIRPLPGMELEENESRDTATAELLSYINVQTTPTSFGDLEAARADEREARRSDTIISQTALWAMDEATTSRIATSQDEVAVDPSRFERISRVVSKDTRLFSVPVMVGSNRCYTRDHPPAPAEAWNRAEGYCVINGMEKAFVPQLNPIANRIIVYMLQKGMTQIVYGEMRCRHVAKIRSTATLYVNITSAPRGMGVAISNVTLPFIERTIPLFAFCRLIGFNTVAGTARVIAMRGQVDESDIERNPHRPELARTELWIQSMLRNRNKDDPDFAAMTWDQVIAWVGDNCLRRRIPSTIAAAVQANAPDLPPGTPAATAQATQSAAAAATISNRKYVQHIISNEFLPQVGLDTSAITLMLKRAMFGFIVWRTASVVRHEMPPDERDHFGNQMIEMPGRLLIHLLRQLYRNMLTRKTVKTMKIKIDSNVFFNPADVIPSRKITNDVMYAMSTGRWGVHKGGSKLQGVVTMLKRINPFATLSQLRGFKKPGDLKDTAPRLLSSHDWGIACPSETSEGENCGLLKHLAAHAYICPGRSTALLIRAVTTGLGSMFVSTKQFTSPDYRPEGKTTLIVNGVMLGVVTDGDAAARCLRQLRRGRALPFDTEIVLFVAHSTLEVSAENGAVRRPLFVLDGGPEATRSRAMRIREICEMYNARDPRLFRRLMREGLVEFVGKHEEATLLIRSDPSVDMDADDVEWGTADGEAEQELLRSLGLDPDAVRAECKRAADVATTPENLRRVFGVPSVKPQPSPSMRLVSELLQQGKWEEARRAIEAATPDSPCPPAAQPFALTAAHRKWIDLERRRAWAERRKQLVDAHLLKHCRPGTAEADEQRFGFTHSEIHPSAIHSLPTSMIPFSNHNQAPRNTFQCAMGKAAIGDPQEIDEGRSYFKFPGAQVPLVDTFNSRMLRPRDMRYGQNVVVWIMCLDGNNQEDSLILCKQNLDLGQFRTVDVKVYSDTASHSARNDPQTFENPGDAVRGKRDCDYSLLNDKGWVEPGTVVQGGAVVIGKTVTVTTAAGVSRAADDEQGSGAAAATVAVKRDQSTMTADNAPPGTVMAVTLADGREKSRIKVLVGRPAIPIIGDKFSARHGQKGVMGNKMHRADMPWGVLPVTIRDEHGKVKRVRYTEVRPDILMNPNAIPSRMTVGQLMEMVAGTAAALGGYIADGTSFQRHLSTKEIGDELERLGLKRNGTVEARSGITGEVLYNCEVFMGVCYYQRLKQLAENKVRAVDRGMRSALTRQPMEGKNGGLRAGEMERDAFIAHGAPEIVHNTFYTRSDAYVAYVCTKCGLLACPPRVPDERLRHVASLRDEAGYCTVCREAGSVARVKTPYALKLLIQELMTIGVAIRPEVRVSDSIDFANAPAPGVPVRSEDDMPKIGTMRLDDDEEEEDTQASITREPACATRLESTSAAAPFKKARAVRSLPGGARVKGPDIAREVFGAEVAAGLMDEEGYGDME